MYTQRHPRLGGSFARASSPSPHHPATIHTRHGKVMRNSSHDFCPHLCYVRRHPIAATSTCHPPGIGSSCGRPAMRELNNTKNLIRKHARKTSLTCVLFCTIGVTHPLPPRSRLSRRPRQGHRCIRPQTASAQCDYAAPKPVSPNQPAD